MRGKYRNIYLVVHGLEARYNGRTTYFSRVFVGKKIRCRFHDQTHGKLREFYIDKAESDKLDDVLAQADGPYEALLFAMSLLVTPRGYAEEAVSAMQGARRVVCSPEGCIGRRENVRLHTRKPRLSPDPA